MTAQRTHFVTSFDPLTSEVSEHGRALIERAIERRRHHPDRGPGEEHREGDLLLVGYKPYRLATKHGAAPVPPEYLANGSAAEHCAQCHCGSTWQLSSSSDSRALAVVDGTGSFRAHGPHYSRRSPGSRTFTGCGQEIVLVTSCGRAV